MKRLSIVVVTYNTRSLLERSLDAVLENVDLKEDEILVVDNASSDGTVDSVRKNYPMAKVIRNDVNRGFAVACNQGYRASGGRYVCLVNSDVILPARTINRMREKMDAHPKIGVLSPELIQVGGEVAQMSWGWNLTLVGEMKQRWFSPRHIGRHPWVRRQVQWLQRRERTVPFVAGACMMIRRDVLDQIGGMDEDYELYFEDADLCRRVWKAGYDVRFTPDIKVIHGLGQSGKSQPKKIWLVYRQSQITFYKKHNTRLESFLLKIYLWIKFLASPIFWRDSNFRYWMIQILREKKRFHLSAGL